MILNTEKLLVNVICCGFLQQRRTLNFRHQLAIVDAIASAVIC